MSDSDALTSRLDRDIEIHDHLAEFATAVRDYYTSIIGLPNPHVETTAEWEGIVARSAIKVVRTDEALPPLLDSLTESEADPYDEAKYHVDLAVPIIKSQIELFCFRRNGRNGPLE